MLECYWVGYLGFNFGGNQGFSIKAAKGKLFADVNSNQIETTGLSIAPTVRPCARRGLEQPQIGGEYWPGFMVVVGKHFTSLLIVV